tara:strand:+ start:3220 stop:3582 length:363 start_codon:yes stop_codon:yes gene_type:complete
MANMTRQHYNLIADIVLKAKLDVEAQKNVWAEQRGGDHELTPLQDASYNSAFFSLQRLGNALHTAFKETFDNFNEDKFREAIKVERSFPDPAYQNIPYVVEYRKKMEELRARNLQESIGA